MFKNIVNDNKKIKLLEKEFESKKLEAQTLSEEIIKLKEEIESLQEFNNISKKDNLNGLEVSSTIFDTLYNDIYSSISTLTNNIKLIDYKKICIKCRCGYDFDEYDDIINEEDLDIPTYIYDIEICIIDKKDKIVYSQLVHCLGNGDGGIYNPFSCKKRESKLEALIYIANIIKNILESIIDKDNISIDILDIDESRDLMIFKNED